MKKYDVIVAGGGAAGISAAIAASRLGKNVLLIERQTLLGGLATLGRINWIEPYCDGEGNQVFGGLGAEFFNHATKCGYQNIPLDWPDHDCRLTSWFSPEQLMLELPRWLQEEKAGLLLDTMITGVQTEKDRVISVTCSHLGGNETIEADAFVDATGSAHLFCLSGAPCVAGRNFLTMIGDTVRRDTIRKALDTDTPYAVRGRRNYGATLDGKGQPDGIPESSVPDAWEETEWILRALSLMRTGLAEEDCRSHEVISLPVIPQIRMLRRIQGRTVFDGTPFAEAEEPIGVIPDFRERGLLYEIPYGSLRCTLFSNLYAAGRCISAEGKGWHNSRMIGACCLTGEAAGQAASLGGDYGRVLEQLKLRGIPLRAKEIRRARDNF